MVVAYPTSVRVSAPAKVLLFGEHAVVYGCPSIAVALTDLRLSVEIERVAGEDAGIEMIFDDIPETHAYYGIPVATRRVYAMDVVRGLLGDDNITDAAFLPRPTAAVLERIERLVANETTERAKTLRPAIFLTCALLHSSQLMTGKLGGLRIRASAGKFPIGAGLGSSAAFSVALAGALVQFREGFGSIDHPQNLELVNQFAFAAEVILHGAPSGVDNTVAAYGGALKFLKLPTPNYSRIACDLSAFRFLIVNTRVPRSTKEQVANVRLRYEADKEATQRQFNEIEAIIAEFIALGSQGTLTETTLGEQMVNNHSILNALGVGHPRIEDVARICKTSGMWTKLTGAGGGGCTVSLVPQSLSEQEISSVIKQLEDEGFECFLSAVGGSGFTIDELTLGESSPKQSL